MPPPTRSLRPACPACGFPVFNRRYPRCEKCQAVLPEQIVYTPAEIVALREKEHLEDQARERRRAREKGQRATRGLGFVDQDHPSSAIGDLLDLGGDLLDVIGDG